MIKLKLIKLIVIGVAGMLISCNVSTNNSDVEKTINDLKDGQQVILKKISALETSMNNLALANKNKPADKKQPPAQADPNKVYNIPIGDSFSKGPKDAAVTIIEWSDFQ